MGNLTCNFLGARNRLERAKGLKGTNCLYTRLLGTGGIGRIGRGVMRYIPIGFHSGLVSIFVDLILLKQFRFNRIR